MTSTFGKYETQEIFAKKEKRNKKQKQKHTHTKRGIWLEHAKKLLTPSTRREDKTR